MNELLTTSLICASTCIGGWNRRSISMSIPLLLILNFCQGQKIDSLKSLLNGGTGSLKCDVLYQIAYEYIDLDNHLGLQYAKQALNAAKEYGDSLRIVKAGRIKSLAFRRLGEFDSSMTLSMEVLAIARRQGYKKEFKSILNALALIYTHNAIYDKALNCYFQSLEIDEDDENAWITLNNIGLVYYKLEDYNKALTYYERSLSLRKERNSEDAITLINMSLCYAYKNNFAVAKDFVRQALANCDNECSKQLQMYATFCSGYIAFGLKEMGGAEAQFKRSYRLASELADERYQLDNIFYMSKVYLITGKIDEAKNLLEQGEKLISSGVSYNAGLIQVYSELANLYRKSGEFEQVAQYQQKYIQLKDSIYGEELTRNLMRVESEYLERENRATIDAQAQILALNKEVIFRQRILAAVTGIIAVLLASISFIVIRNNRQKRSANLFLEQKVKERTIELERNNDALLRSMEEQTIILQKMSSDIKGSMATIKGLCALVVADGDSTFGGQYVRKIEATSDQLLSIVGRTLKPTR